MKYSSLLQWNQGHFWTKTIKINNGAFEYKYIVFEERTGRVIWERGANRKVFLTEGSQTLNDVWETPTEAINYYSLESPKSPSVRDVSAHIETFDEAAFRSVKRRLDFAIFGKSKEDIETV